MPPYVREKPYWGGDLVHLPRAWTRMEAYRFVRAQAAGSAHILMSVFVLRSNDLARKDRRGWAKRCVDCMNALGSD